MQGQLSEIDIRSILQLIELGQRTGELFVEAYPSQAVSFNATFTQDGRSGKTPSGKSWFVFFLNGQIVYAAEAEAGLSRLRDYLRRYKAESALGQIEAPAIATINAPEYGYLWALLENHLLTPAQGRSIMQSMVRETLFDLLSLHQGTFVFELGPPLAPQLMTLEIAPLVAQIMIQVQEWKQFHPHLQSPEQRATLADPLALQEALPAATFVTLDRYADGKTSLRQVARYLNRDILTVARAIYPYIQRGWIQLMQSSAEDLFNGSAAKVRSRDLGLWQPIKAPRIACIDDGATVRATVEAILDQHGYDVTAVGDPIQALSLMFQLKPDLILCDIAMPELDGYEICAMLRKSTAFRQIPIVMLTGKDGFIDRVKARMVGATDYLTKPFGESELLMLLEKYVGLGDPQRPKSDRLLIDLSKDELEINIT
jgi:twitching motility two-component system response regulator PilG